MPDNNDNIQVVNLSALGLNTPLDTGDHIIVFKNDAINPTGLKLSKIGNIIPKNIIYIDKQENVGVKNASDNTKNNAVNNPIFLTENNFYPMFGGINIPSTFPNDSLIGKNCKISCKLIGSVEKTGTNPDRCQFFFRFVIVDSGNIKKVLTNKNISSSNKKIINSILSFNFVSNVTYYSFTHQFSMYANLSLLKGMRVVAEVMKFNGNPSSGSTSTYGGDLILNSTNNNTDNEWNIESSCYLNVEILHSSLNDTTSAIDTYKITN